MSVRAYCECMSRRLMPEKTRHVLGGIDVSEGLEDAMAAYIRQNLPNKQRDSGTAPRLAHNQQNQVRLLDPLPNK